MIKSKDLLKTLKWIKKGVGTNAARKNLHSISFKQKSETLEIMSANAYLILTESIDLHTSGNDCFEIVADNKYLYEIIGLLDALHKEEIVKFVKDGENIKIKTLSGDQSRVIQKYDFDFPDLSKIINIDEDPKLETGKIKLWSKMLQICLQGFENPIIKFHGEEKPVLIIENSRKALIMPIKQGSEK